MQRPCDLLNGLNSIAMSVARIAASRADWGARNRLCRPRARITHCSGLRRTAGTPGMRSAGYAASADRSCLVILSRLRVRAPRAARYTRHALPHKFDLEINRRRYAPRTVGKSRACQVVPTTPGQGSSERGGQSVTIDSAILTTSSQSRKGASMPAARAGVIPPSSSCGWKRL